MEEVYDLHQHTDCVIFYVDKTSVYIEIYDTSNRHLPRRKIEFSENASISYNKQKTRILSWSNYLVKKRSKEGLQKLNSFIKGIYRFFKKKDIIQVDDFMNRLYHTFEKDKDTWDEHDNFLIEAISEFFCLVIVELLEKRYKGNEGLDSFHYAFVVPSEWEEEIREDLIRPIFYQANLLHKDDHKDRLLFISDIESTCYALVRPDNTKYLFKRGQNTVMCKCTFNKSDDVVLVELYLLKTINTLFNFPNSMLFPKIMRSNSLYITSDSIKDGIKTFLKENLFPDSQSTDQNDTIETMKGAIFKSVYTEKRYDDDDDIDKFMKPIFTSKTEWKKLNNSQLLFVNSIRPFDICAVIGKSLLNKLKDIFLNEFVKKYELLIVESRNSFKESEPRFRENTPIYLKIWLKYMLEYNRRVLNGITTLTTIHLKHSRYSDKKFDGCDIFTGTMALAGETIQNSEMYCAPRIIPNNDAESSSVFLNSKPNVIINIDISYKSTLLSYSLLNEDGLTEETFDHSYFATDRCLPSLENFYNVSNTTTLTVKENFISLAEKHLLRDFSSSSLNKDLLFKIEVILSDDHSTKKALIFTEQKEYIKAFLLMYLIYTREIISSRLPKHAKFEKTGMKVGYAISTEKMILENIIGTKEDFRELIYTSGLIKKDDNFKKLRITTEGEGVLSTIQQSFDLDFPMKSYFVFAQLQENYIQLTLNQVVTVSSLEYKQQETIVIKEKIVSIQNIYDSLCLNMWNCLIQDNSLIQLCNVHNDNETFELFSLKTKIDFMSNFKQYISNNIPSTNYSNLRIFEKSAIKLNNSCDCKAILTVNDIIDISFRPLLKDITSIMLASLINEKIFGNYKNIKYHFCLFRFNCNYKFQDILTAIMKEKADNFNPKRGIETMCMVLPKIPNDQFQPALKLQPLLYKEFQIGTLQQIYSENYAFSIYFDHYLHGSNLILKNKRTDSEGITVNFSTAFPLSKKGDMINHTEINKTFYLEVPFEFENNIYIDIYRYNTSDTIKKDGTILEKKDTWKTLHKFQFGFLPLDYVYNSIPLMFTVRSVGYSSSFQFFVRPVGKGIIEEVFETGETMTLSRF